LIISFWKRNGFYQVWWGCFNLCFKFEKLLAAKILYWIWSN
jgi:hypothetical protein